MREEAAARVHHVGVAATPRLNLSDGPLDRLEADLGRGDLHGILPDRDREREVWLHAIPEVHRAPVRLPRSRLAELRSLREILLAGHRIQGQPRNAELLLARYVEMAELADRRHVADKAQEVELALLGQGRPSSPRKASFPSPSWAAAGSSDAA